MKKYELELSRLNKIKSELNVKSTKLSRLELRRELIFER